MQQQINFYQAEFRTTRANFSAAMLLMACGAMVLAMLVAFGFQTYKLEGIKSELRTVNNQEQAAIQRLENFQPAGDTDSGGKSWTERLEDAKLSLREQQLVLSMVRDSTLGDTQGFSRHLTSLARPICNSSPQNHRSPRNDSISSRSMDQKNDPAAP